MPTVILRPTGEVRGRFPEEDAAFYPQPTVSGAQNVWLSAADGSYATARSLASTTPDSNEAPSSQFEPLPSIYPTGSMTRLAVKAKISNVSLSAAHIPRLSCETYHDEGAFAAYDSDLRSTIDLVDTTAEQEVEWSLFDPEGDPGAWTSQENIDYFRTTIMETLRPGIFLNFFAINGGFGVTSYDSSFQINEVWIEVDVPEPPADPTPRPHYHHTLRTDSGEVYRGVNVRLLVPGTDTRPPDQQVYLSATGEAQRTTHWHVPDGVIDFYVDRPATFDILVTPLDPGQQPFRLEGQWVGDVENRAGETPSARGVPAGHMPVADGVGSWGWDAPGSAVESVNSRTGEVSVDAEELGAMTLFGAQRIRAMTRAAYDALTSKDEQTLYLIRAVPVVAPETLTILRTEVFTGALGDYPSDYVIPYGPANLSDGSDATGIRLSSAEAADWWVVLDGAALAGSSALSIKIRFNVLNPTNDPEAFRIQVNLSDGDGAIAPGNGLWPSVAEVDFQRDLWDGVSEETFLLNEAWVAAHPLNPPNPDGQYASLDGVAAPTYEQVRDGLLGGDQQVVLYLNSGSSSRSPFEVDVLSVEISPA